MPESEPTTSVRQHMTSYIYTEFAKYVLSGRPGHTFYIGRFVGLVVSAIEKSNIHQVFSNERPSSR